ncbi:leucyl/phenylalanyl-tRNA--protein transferase [Sphingomonas sp. KRR8]|uniref:leucyl/phenylalanyl-tRNA--protein transferase n=1 Tax=Sphingomonas sp. KRR8 TaxID=2942996 RepID=UPI00201FD407|nr:leucyl/phenylalanyl-tRNA--protein transferase [Sphingomonas sp. KRR8]URD60641.1 leucyl/phenylalanyl-tRNA--protein transferase [Sphingomonas sp. KRR8]
MTVLDLRLVLQGYATGIFPMAESRDSEDLFWVEPRERAILPLQRFHVSRSLARRMRSGQFTVTRDRDFAGVLEGCADRPETWINPPIANAMTDLHRLGRAHSIEVWEGGALVGGVYGVRLGRAFFGESMFSRTRDASKVALAWLVARLRAGGFTLLDCQFITDHLASLGAEVVSRDDYVALLSAAVGVSVTGASSAGSSADGSAAAVPREGDFAALEALLDAAGVAGEDGPSGKFITQFLTQTS